MTGTAGPAAGASSAAGAVASAVLQELARRGETLAVAESLTGGLVAGALTGVPGASRTFRGGVTAYATDVKRDVLGVEGPLLDRCGAVDVEVARGMAQGVRRLLCADWGLATTGVAGPEGQDGKPVGLVYVALAGPQPSDADEEPSRGRELHLPGEREDVRAAAALSALELLRSALQRDPPAARASARAG
ncbi:CinA family protein [Streptomyces sp. TR06-5]|uniref:CinA family protein n=1 Tax=Streptomyces sp. TR06-5 TaxID=3385976 RepID=UPI0039A35F13